MFQIYVARGITHMCSLHWPNASDKTYVSGHSAHSGVCNWIFVFVFVFVKYEACTNPNASDKTYMSP